MSRSFRTTLILVIILLSMSILVNAEPANKIVFKGWNAYSTRFVNPPKYDWDPVPNVVKYRIGVASIYQKKAAWYETTGSEFDFSPIWATLPMGRVDLRVCALDKDGKHLTNGQHRKLFFKVPGWNGDEQRPMDWEKVIEQNIRYLLLPRQDYKRPFEKEDDPRFLYSATESQTGQRVEITYPSRDAVILYSLYLFAAYYPDHELTAEAKRQGEIYGRWLLENHMPEDYVYSKFPFTTLLNGITDENYGGSIEGKEITIDMAADIGSGMVRMYKETKDEKYLNYAKELADVFVKNQKADGSWPARVNPKTGTSDSPDDYGVSAVRIGKFIAEIERITTKQQYTNARKKAMKWILENPVKTNRWQSFFEDVGYQQPYRNLSPMDAMYFIRFLLHFKDQIPDAVKIAEKVNVFVEDQFVIWNNEYSNIEIHSPTPMVMEQYGCYTPMDAHTGNWVLSLAALHNATGNEDYLKKAVAAMNAISKTMYNNGELSTTWTWAIDQRFGTPLWGNNWACAGALTAHCMMEFNRYYKSVQKENPKLFDLLEN